MNEQEYRHYSRLLAQNPIFNKKSLTNSVNGAIMQAKDAKDFPELAKHMKNTHGIDIDPSVFNLDYESVREGIEGIERVLGEFPQAKAAISEISTDNSGIMCASYSGKINFNPSYYDTRAHAVYASQTTGFHPKGNNVISTGSHEAGHILEKALIDKNTGGGILGQIAWNGCTYAKTVVSDACKAAKKLPDGKGKRNAELIGEISGYAKANASECMAEAVADYTLNGKNAAVLSREIWNILKKELG